jgi:hypothetical protein
LPAAPKDLDGLISRENIWIDAGAATTQLTSEAETETSNG